MNLTQCLGQRAAEHPDRPAIFDPSGGEVRSRNYGELWDRVCGGAGLFRSLGLLPGDVILVIHPITIELYEVLLASFHAGLVVVMVDPARGGEFLDQTLKRVPPKVFFGSAKAHALRLKYPAIRRIGVRFHTGHWVPGSIRWEPENAESVPQPVEVAPEHPALITFTSGTTGIPKGVVRSHRFLLAQNETLRETLDLCEGEVDLVTLPVFLLANLACGLTSVIADTDLSRPGNPDVVKLMAQVNQLRPSRCTASPAFFEALLGHPDFFCSLRKIYTGGAPVFPRLLGGLSAMHPEMDAHAVYGSSEAEPIAHLRARQIGADVVGEIAKGGGLPAGIPVSSIRVAIIEDRWGTPLGPFSETEFEALKLPTGSSGEIVVSGEHVLGGYLDGVGDESTKVRVGSDVWHRTGDAGSLDASGSLWLLGRCTAAMSIDGMTLYPLQVEAAVSALASVERCACVQHGGEIVLVVEGPECVMGQVRELAAWMPIQKVVRMELIPVDARHNAKVDYSALRERLEQLER